MAKSTALVVAVLAVLVVTIIGVNLIPGKRGAAQNPPPAKTAPTPVTNLLTHTDAVCGIEIGYPDNLNILEGPTGSVIFTGKSNTANVIIATCQTNIPRPAITSDKIEELKSGSVSASLYHDASAKDGRPIDKLIFTNPRNNLDIFISGYGPEFQEIIGNIKLIQ